MLGARRRTRQERPTKNAPGIRSGTLFFDLALCLAVAIHPALFHNGGESSHSAVASPMTANAIELVLPSLFN